MDSFPNVMHMYGFLGMLTDAERNALFTNPWHVKNCLARLAMQSVAPLQAIPLRDNEVPRRLRPMIELYRQIPTEQEYLGPRVWGVMNGCTLKSTIPRSGRCHEDFRHLQKWDFDDEPTVSAVVFWVPRLLKGSVGKSRREQLVLLSKLRHNLGLPEHHLTGFGSAALVAALLVAELLFGENDTALVGSSVRTDTRRREGDFLKLGVTPEKLLSCTRYGKPCQDPILGAFALGIERMG